MCLLLESTDWQAFVFQQDEKNRSCVRLCAERNGGRFCVNDLLVQENYAAVVGDGQLGRLCQFCHAVDFLLVWCYASK